MKKQTHVHGNGAQAGSTIVGVLVATVFMGIVVGSMVKNTGSQSAASRSYGAMHVASSTISSGMIETERYLASAAGTAVAQGIIQRHVNGESLSGAAPYLLHSNGQKRYLVNAATTPDQMYSSQIERVIPQNNSRIFAAVDLKSGRHASGDRTIREAMTFGVLGNVTLVPQNVTPPSSPSGGKNALFIGGSTNVIANVPLNIDGKATFMSNLHQQRNIHVTNGDLWVQGRITGTGSETITAPDGITSNTPAPDSRVEKPLDMSHLPQSVGVTSQLGNNGAITHSGAPGNVPTRYSINSNGRTLTTADLTAIYNNAKDNGRLHGGTHVVVELNASDNFSLGFSSNDTFNGNVIFVVNKNIEINNFYKSGENSSTMMYVAPPRDPVKIPNPNYNTCCPGQDWNPAEITVNYPGGKLNQFNIKSDFTGLIYVDPQNTHDQRIAIGNNINFKGALHMMGKGAFELNNGGNGTLNIKHDPEVLKGFKVPREGGDDDDDEDNADNVLPPVVTIPEGRTIIFRSSGYYFF